MVRAFLILSALVIIGLVAGILFLSKKENTVRPSLQLVGLFAALATLWNAVAVISGGEFLADLSYGMYFASTEWMVFCILVFCYRFTGETKRMKSDVKFWGLLCGIDSLSLLANAWLHHIFYCEVAELGNGGIHGYVLVPNGNFYYFHMIISYGMVIVAMVILVRSMIQTVPLYRFRYWAVLGGFAAIVLLNVFFQLLGIRINLTPLFYLLSSAVLTYFSMFYIPRGLETGLIAASVQDLKNGIICFDREGKCVYFNDGAKDFFGTDSKAQMEAYFLTWSLDREDELDKSVVWMESKELEDGTHSYEIHYHALRDERGSFIGSCFSICDRTMEQQNYEREHFRATHDNLTGLYNREGFFEKARLRLDHEKDVRWLVVCTDIKDFKLINDLFGVEKGDSILKHVAEIMKREAGNLSEFGRLSGDRFAMLIPKAAFSEERFEAFAGELCKLAENDVYRMHIHVGVYNVENKALEVSIMCDRAFLAIQRIKNNYHQIIAYYDAGLGNQQIAEKRMIAEFENALNAGQFKMFLQPQIAADLSQKLLGAEALVRWMHPTQGMISPGAFIPVFEQSGLIYKLDYFIWETACARLKKWKEQGRDDLHISVNISQKDFYFMDLYQTFTGLAEKYEIDPSKLKLEITETALMSEIKQQLGLLDRLRKYGFHIEIDDFGSGYSSLNTLKDIEVDVLKLDMGFLSKTIHEERSRTIMNSIISMSKQLGLTVITEGVETFEQVEYLKSAGCDMFQGYYFAKPMAVENFEERYIED